MKEQIILVDLFDQPVGNGEKQEVHRKGQLHRAFSVFLYHGTKMLIQKRAASKYHSGGLWANTCCSHPRVGEDLREAVSRRLREETGISCPVKEVFTFVYQEKFANGLVEYEYDHVFVGDYQGDIKVNQEEASEVIWVEAQWLAGSLCLEPDAYCAWFRIAAPRVLAMMREKMI